MSAPRVWFRNAIEGLFVRGLADVHCPALLQQWAEVGLRLDRLENEYPVATFARALEMAGPFVAPAASPAAQQRELGRRFTRGYFATPLGLALSKALQLVGPRLALSRVDRTYRTVSNYLRARALTVERQHAVIEFEPAAQFAEFLVGQGEGSFEVLHRGPWKMQLDQVDGERVISSVEWS